MRLNSIKPSRGSRPASKRLGRGGGSGLGKTSGKGHKGQHARAGGYHKVGFEGGQMPMQRRLPKFGFVSPTRDDTAEVRLGELNHLEGAVTIEALKAANLVARNASRVRVFLSGELKRAVSVAKDIHLTRGARAAVLAAGGKVEADG
ncbi:MAG TPA: 50S ribosomal protein L15 [Acidiferrobacteraceae bacterium]|nr:50S ribosomal protein L15 [Acidiferrobacteraceae bacterium]